MSSPFPVPKVHFVVAPNPKRWKVQKTCTYFVANLRLLEVDDPSRDVEQAYVRSTLAGRPFTRALVGTLSKPV